MNRNVPPDALEHDWVATLCAVIMDDYAMSKDEALKYIRAMLFDFDDELDKPQ